MGRALVVDDDRNVAQLIKEALNQVGYDVVMVESPSDAISEFEKKTFDVLISDWMMPLMNGIELVTTLKQKDPHLASILMTGYGSTKVVVDAFTRGKINYYLSKPFRIAELLETVSAALKERRISLSEIEFRNRLEREIKQATHNLNQKNILLKKQQAETENLYRQLMKRQEEIEETKDYLENLIESSLDAIISVNDRSRISFFSRGAEEMFGYRSVDAIDRPFHFLFKNRDSEPDRLLKMLSREKRIKHFETILISKSGQEIHTDISISQLLPLRREKGLLLIIKDITERIRLEEELKASNLVLEKLSITDGLTNLYNHRYFQKCLTEEFQRARRFNTSLSLIMLDLDDFKSVNDTHGHPVGDKVLMALSEVLKETVRGVDTPARYGGEEFAVILPQTDVEAALAVAARIKDKIGDTSSFREVLPDLHLTASLGLCGYPDPGVKSTEDLIRFADKALYLAKEIGKNRVVIGSSFGLIPIGKGERISASEKAEILNRVEARLRGAQNLREISDYLLGEIKTALYEPDNSPPCAIMLTDVDDSLVTIAEYKMSAEWKALFLHSSRKALEKRGLQIYRDPERSLAVSAFPMMETSAARGEKAVGVINTGVIPSDPDFFQELANRAAVFFLKANGKIH